MKFFILLAVFFIPAIILLMMFAPFAPGGAAALEPIQAPCTQEKAEEYASVCDEIGAPWELAILIDSYIATDIRKNSIEDFNPLETALELLVLTEREYRWIAVGESEDGDPVYERVCVNATDYTGKEEILNYTEIRGDLSFVSSSFVIAKANDIAGEKNDEISEYEVSFSVNPDLSYVLTGLIGMNEKDAQDILELYESHYIAYLYIGDASFFESDYELPEIVAGNVSRLDLAKVAASIINHPYRLGYKSPYEGLPRGPLDCSGYVDWVYVQCFGRGVNGSNVDISSGTAIQFYSSADIGESELKIGDLGFYQHPRDVTGYNHVGIYIGDIDGQRAFIHCGGSGFGYSPERESGRVGISKNGGGSNSINPFGGSFSPPMYSTNFRYFKRPQFQFTDDDITEPSEE